MLRLGLCCTFQAEPIKFRTTTVRHVSTLEPARRVALLHELATHNAAALSAAITWCAGHGVGAFRVQNGILPLYTHPAVGWTLAGPEGRGVAEALRAAGALARAADIRLSFHPDQFVVPGSQNPAVVESSLRELEYLAEVGELIGAQQLTIHGGGAQGGKVESLARLGVGLDRLSPRARALVVLENDDRVYTVEDLLPLCRSHDVPLIYDVHHHRCNPDRHGVEEATDLAAATWRGGEPWAHLSSPIVAWSEAGDHRPHADQIDTADLPRCWLGRRMTVDVEAKAKEDAVLRLARWLRDGAANDDRAAETATPAARPPAPARAPAQPPKRATATTRTPAPAKTPAQPPKRATATARPPAPAKTPAQPPKRATATARPPAPAKTPARPPKRATATARPPAPAKASAQPPKRATAKTPVRSPAPATDPAQPAKRAAARRAR